MMQEWRGPYATGTELRSYNVETKKWDGRNIYVPGKIKTVMRLLIMKFIMLYRRIVSAFALKFPKMVVQRGKKGVTA